jgi:hypothetical protein
VSSRYERASLVVTSNKPFSAWDELFDDDMAATAMIDRHIHHSEILSLKDDSYRLRGEDLDAPHRRQARRVRLMPNVPWAPATQADTKSVTLPAARRMLPSRAREPARPTPAVPAPAIGRPTLPSGNRRAPRTRKRQAPPQHAKAAAVAWNVMKEGLPGAD